MKKQLHFFFALVVFVLNAGSAQAHDFEAENADNNRIYYKITSDTTVTVTYKGNSALIINDYSGQIIIPSVVTYNENDYAVTAIGEFAFLDCASLTSIIIPPTVILIDYYAFYRSGLTSIIIPNSVVNIGYYVFDGCSNLTSINVESNNPLYSSINGILYNKAQTILQRCPQGKTGTLTIPNSVILIDACAFLDCQLTSVLIPNSVIKIGAMAFAGCHQLTGISIPNSVTSIDEAAFKDCHLLLSIIIPNSIILIAKETFADCQNLISIVIPDSITSIGDYAFSGCKRLTSLTIGESVTTIGKGAFSVCTGLTSIVIPNSVITINWYAFAGCTGLTSIVIPNSVITINGGAFGNCNNLTDVTIGESVTYIDEKFASCTTLNFNAINCETRRLGGNIRTLNIGNKVERISEYAFAENFYLTGTLVIPNSVKSIGKIAFSGGYNLTSIVLGNSIDTIGGCAFDFFSYSHLTDITSYATVPPILESRAFGSTNILPVSLHVPCGSETAYQTAAGWSEFTNYSDCISADVKNVEKTDLQIYVNNNELSFQNTDLEIRNVVIYDLTGKIINHFPLTIQNSIDISYLPTGIYLLKMQREKDVITKKFIKK